MFSLVRCRSPSNAPARPSTSCSDVDQSPAPRLAGVGGAQARRRRQPNWVASAHSCPPGSAGRASESRARSCVDGPQVSCEPPAGAPILKRAQLTMPATHAQPNRVRSVVASSTRMGLTADCASQAISAPSTLRGISTPGLLDVDVLLKRDAPALGGVEVAERRVLRVARSLARVSHSRCSFASSPATSECTEKLTPSSLT